MTQAQARDRALDYLAAHRVMTLATQGPEGLWAADVFYVNSGFNLYFVSSHTSRHGRNLAAQPQVAATVHDDYLDWREIKGIQLEGAVERVAAAEEAGVRTLYGRKFPVAADLTGAPAPIVSAFAKARWYKLAATRVYFIDNSAGFGHRDPVF